MAAILFVDMLGARRIWQNGGVQEAIPAFFRFKKMVNIAARQAPNGEVLDGGIETDAAMIVCRSPIEAFRIGQRLFLAAFSGRLSPETPRLWLRGCVVPHPEEGFLRSGEPLRDPVDRITAYRYSESALEAVSIEKSGYKGMRLLVHSELITSSVQTQMRVPLGGQNLIPFRRLNYSIYPARLDRLYTDFLWMACETDDDWFKLSLQMKNRLRYAGPDPEELAQAAATQLVFNECAAIRRSLESRIERQRE